MTPTTGGEATDAPPANPVDLATSIMSTVPPPTGGITITERGDLGPLPKPSRAVRGKGKGVAEDIGSGSESDSDEGDFRIVPFSQQPNPTQVECSQARVRISDVESREAVGSHAAAHETANTKAGRSGDVEVNSCSIWGRVEEALQSILTNMSDDPPLFCRDAPPVFNDGKSGGNL